MTKLSVRGRKERRTVERKTGRRMKIRIKGSRKLLKMRLVTGTVAETRTVTTTMFMTPKRTRINSSSN